MTRSVFGGILVVKKRCLLMRKSFWNILELVDVYNRAVTFYYLYS